MYTNDKLYRITLRLNEEQFSFVNDNATFVGTTPSGFLRMVINAAISTNKTFNDNSEGEVDGRENDKTCFNDII